MPTPSFPFGRPAVWPAIHDGPSYSTPAERADGRAAAEVPADYRVEDVSVALNSFPAYVTEIFGVTLCNVAVRLVRGSGWYWRKSEKAGSVMIAKLGDSSSEMVRQGICPNVKCFVTRLGYKLSVV